MRYVIKTADDLVWLLRHTHRFKGGQVSDLHVHKRRLYDESTGREVTAGTVITAVLRYDLSSGSSWPSRHAITRVAKLTMIGVTDFSLFEQEGADFSKIGEMHGEASEGRLRFWFDPRGELYVICDEAELEEVSRPGPRAVVRNGMSEWTFQAEAGSFPPVTWLLDQLDQSGVPCAWRARKQSPPSHPALQWEGQLIPASAQVNARSGVLVQAFGPLNESGFGITLRPLDPHEIGTAKLLVALADLIARTYSGICLAGSQVMAGEEWLEERLLAEKLGQGMPSI